MITVVKENRPKEGVRAPNEQPAPFPLNPPFSAPPCPPFFPVVYPRNQCTRGAPLGAPVICQRWTLGFRDPRPVDGVSSLSSVLDSTFTWKPVKLLSWQLRCDSVFVGA